MPKDIFVINNGSIIVTPTLLPNENTVTLKFANGYHKLRHIQVELASKVTSCVEIRFNPDTWYQIGTGNSAILFNKDQLNNAIFSIKDLPRQNDVMTTFHSCRSLPAQIESVLEPSLSPLSRVFNGVL
jgi:hypothetical protein